MKYRGNALGLDLLRNLEERRYILLKKKVRADKRQGWHEKAQGK